MAYCDFSSGYCQWESDPDGEYQFSRRSGNLLGGQGPSADFEGDAEGIYAVADPALTEKDTASAKLISPKLDRNTYESVCFQFWYSVKGVRRL